MEETVATLRKHLPDLQAIYFFGSRATGNSRPDSDWDLAVLLPRACTPERLWDIAGALATALDAPVDLVDLRSASTVMQYQVVTTGVRLWRTDVQADLFECFVFAEKNALDEARAGQIADIMARGKVYG